jgi:hypothetical protein
MSTPSFLRRVQLLPVFVIVIRQIHHLVFELVNMSSLLLAVAERGAGGRANSGSVAAGGIACLWLGGASARVKGSRTRDKGGSGSVQGLACGAERLPFLEPIFRWGLEMAMNMVGAREVTMEERKEEGLMVRVLA